MDIVTKTVQHLGRSFVTVAEFVIPISRIAQGVKKRQSEHTNYAPLDVCSKFKGDKHLLLTPLNFEAQPEENVVLCWHQKLYHQESSEKKSEQVKQNCKLRNDKRIHSYWQTTKAINEIRNKAGDKRPYAEVKLLGRKMLGLLDTGAAMSCIGGRLAKEVVLNNFKINRIFGNASTADGIKQPILGKLKTEIIYDGQEKLIDLYVVPTLSQDLYLGIDFWTLFNLLPSSFQISELKLFELNSMQKEKLLKVISQFPSFSVLGLGKTNLMSHAIDVGDAKPIKQRHFPVSPAG